MILKADDRPHVSPALDAVNDEFHERYDRARAAEERKGAVLVLLADDLVVILRDGTRRTLPLTPRLFHVIKSVAHVPVALFAAMYRGKSEVPLKKLRRFIDDSLASLAKEEHAQREAEGADPDTLDALQTVLQESRTFVERVLALDSSMNEPDRAHDLLSAFAVASGKRLLHLTELATRVQLTALHTAVEKALGELDESELRDLEVVVTGNHQARARSLGMQYFRKRLGESEGAEDRVAYAEAVEDADEALALVGTRRMDAEIANAFFADAKRLQEDVLGDAARDLLESTELDPIR